MEMIICIYGWIILIITHSGLYKNHSWKLIIKLESLGNTWKMSEIVSWKIGVMYDEKHSWIISSQSTPNFEKLLILNNKFHCNILFCKVSWQNTLLFNIYIQLCNFSVVFFVSFFYLFFCKICFFIITLTH